MLGQDEELGALYAQVAVAAPLLRHLTYRVPATVGAALREGHRVLVPLGRRSVLGVVDEVHARAPSDFVAREITEVLDPLDRPALGADLMATLRWAAEYYLAPPGEVVRCALPAALSPTRSRWTLLTEQGRRQAEEPDASPALLWLARRPRAAASTGAFLAQVQDEAEYYDALERGWIESRERIGPARGAPKIKFMLRAGAKLKAFPDKARAEYSRAPARIKVIDHVLAGGTGSSAELAQAAGVSASVVRALLEADWLESFETTIDMPRALPAGDYSADPPPSLSEDQRSALASLEPILAAGEFQSVVLFGVTGSGKTEVYLRAAEKTLARGKTVLYLVPEIGLTPQHATSLIRRFGDLVVMLHSGLDDRQRYDSWQRTRDGRARVVVGARSALFAPLDRLGLIIVDEEHDQGYKQEETPRYHARDLALVRGRAASAVVILGSATPSLESWRLARSGNAVLLELPRRVGAGKLADVQVVDMREEFRETGEEDLLSRPFVAALNAALEREEQAMILLNRRGHTRILLCRACGDGVECRSCSVPMVWHRDGVRLRCHYCGYERQRPLRCPSCESEHLADFGAGTQALEEVVEAAVPGARVARLDRDVARSHRRLAEVLGSFNRHEIDILVGTQMIAKGHHFPRVTVVGVLSADATLRMPDFRAAERTFQLVTQVAGRAGRGEFPGTVFVQAYRPDHPALVWACEQDYRSFADKELPARASLHYPPTAALANIIVRDKNRALAQERAEAFASAVRKAGQDAVAVLGPAEAPLARLRDQWRVQLLVRARRRRRLIESLRSALADLLGKDAGMPGWLMLDIDPRSLL